MRFPPFPSKSYLPGHIRWLYRLSHVPPSVSIFPLDVLQFTTIYPVSANRILHTLAMLPHALLHVVFLLSSPILMNYVRSHGTTPQQAPNVRPIILRVTLGHCHLASREDKLRSSGVSFSVTTSSVRSRATALKMPGDTVQIKVEFSGGLELLFDNKRSHKLELPASVPKDNNTAIPPNIKEGEGKAADVAYLIAYLRDHLLQERAELFEEGGTVYVGFSHPMPGILIERAAIDRRPGILVLVNDTDWELEGEGEYVLQDGDEIVFISTLHGG
ncbi:hypothetical protein NMY22_g18019 [Coprinellus aureogranulatus]|nr:hypothetical protein NMY22_g18019 [Coprinellus aureogranulatus]